MTDLDRLADFERSTAGGAALAFERVANVRGDGGGEVAAGRDIAEVIVEFVGAGDHVGAAFEILIEHDGEAVAEKLLCGGEADRPEIAGRTLEPGLELLRAHIAELARASDAEQLGLVHRVIAAEEDGERLPFTVFRECHIGQRFDVVLRQHVEEGHDVCDGGLAGGVDALRLAVARGGQIFYGREPRGRLF